MSKTAIEELIRSWASAVHSGDLEAIVAHHTDDLVMFDVPPPEQGIRGLEQYREIWPPFSEWQRSGAVFEIETLEVEAGEDVAFAWALLRCGTPPDYGDTPDQRLRLSFGLRKVDGTWQIAHEHHSFTHPG